jgi:hypothetical protein
MGIVPGRGKSGSKGQRLGSRAQVRRRPRTCPGPRIVGAIAGPARLQGDPGWRASRWGRVSANPRGAPAPVRKKAKRGRPRRPEAAQRRRRRRSRLQQRLTRTSQSEKGALKNCERRLMAARGLKNADSQLLKESQLYRAILLLTNRHFRPSSSPTNVPLLPEVDTDVGRESAGRFSQLPRSK